MDWFFRLMTIVVTVSFAAVVSLGLASMIFHGRSGAGFLRLPLAALPVLIGLYASIHVIVSCLTDDREEFPPRSQTD